MAVIVEATCQLYSSIAQDVAMRLLLTEGVWSRGRTTASINGYDPKPLCIDFSHADNGEIERRCRQRQPPTTTAKREIACCSSCALSVGCVTERGMQQLGIVSDGAAGAPAAPDVAADVWDSHANVLNNQACMSPQRWL